MTSFKLYACMKVCIGLLMLPIFRSQTTKPFYQTNSLLEVLYHFQFPLCQQPRTFLVFSLFWGGIFFQTVFFKVLLLSIFLTCSNYAVLFEYHLLLINLRLFFSLKTKFLTFPLLDILTECRQKSICVTNNCDILAFL